MAGSLTITGIALAIQEMVASWTSMMVSHRSMEADLVDLLRKGVIFIVTGSIGIRFGVSGASFPEVVVLPRYPKIWLCIRVVVSPLLSWAT